MLVVMTFNIGIILAVSGGYAIGALLFGHAGEPSTLSPILGGGHGGGGGGSSAAMAAAVGGPGLGGQVGGAAAPQSDLETAFVDGSTCCCSGNVTQL